MLTLLIIIKKFFNYSQLLFVVVINIYKKKRHDVFKRT